MAENIDDKLAGFDFKKFFFSHKLIWVFAVLAALAAGLFGVAHTSPFGASLAITVSRQGEQTSADYHYDNYYALKASDEFGDTVAAWFKTPEFVKSVLEKAGVSAAGLSFAALAGNFSAQKLSPNVVEVRFGIGSEAQAKQFAQAIASVTRAKIDELNSASNHGIDFADIVGAPVVVENKYVFWWNALEGFLIGLIFGFFVFSAKNYLL